MGVSIVGANVTAALSRGVEGSVAALVAGCAERTAQVVTSALAVEPAPGRDVETVLSLLDDLWDATVPPARFEGYATTLSSWPELAAREDGDTLIEPEGIHTAYGLLALRHAAQHRARRDTESAIACAHIALTSAAQLDTSLRVPSPSFVDRERGAQAADVDGDLAVAVGRRRQYQAIGRERLVAVRFRTT